MPIRGLGTVYAFDLGRLTGFCKGKPGAAPESGSYTLYKPSEGIGQGFANFLDILQTEFTEDPPSLVVWAAPMSPQAQRDLGSSSAGLRSMYGYRGVLEAVTRRFDAFPKEVHEATARKHFIGKGRAPEGQDIKDLVLQRCHLIEFFPKSVRDEDRADACCLWDWACAYYGTLSSSTKSLFLFNENPLLGGENDGKTKAKRPRVRAARARSRR